MDQGTFTSRYGVVETDCLLSPDIGLAVGRHAEQVVGDVRVAGVQLGGEQLAEGAEHLALALEV